MIDKMINIVHLHFYREKYFTGIDRYIEVHKHGITNYCQEKNFMIHNVYIDNSEGRIFINTKSNSDGSLFIQIPNIWDNTLLFKTSYWRKKYLKAISTILTPKFKEMENIIFHCHNISLIDLAYEMKSLLQKGKVLIHLHCLPWKYLYNENKYLFNQLMIANIKKEYKEFKRVEDSLEDYSLADKIICLSNIAKEYLENIHSIPKEKIEIILNGIDCQTIISKECSDSHTFNILYVGKISIDKGFNTLLDVLIRVKRKGYNFKLMVAGYCPEEIRKRIELEYTPIYIEFLGQIEYTKLVAVYQSSTIGVIPSFYEQCSYVALEMSAFGLPMIVSKIDALSEMFEHEQTALFIPQHFSEGFSIMLDEDIFEQNIIRLINDSQLRETLGHNAKTAYKEKFTLEKMIEKTINLYHEIL